MKTSLLRLGAVFGISIGALALPNTALAGGGGGLCGGQTSGPQVVNCHFSGLFAEAGYSVGSFATSETDVSIGAMDGTSLQSGSGGPAEQENLYVSISQIKADPTQPKGVDFVTELWGYAPVTSGLSINKSLSGASLTNVVIPVSGFDANGPVNGRLITINADWTGTGPVSHFTASYTYHSGAFTYSERFASSDRAATATASVVDGSTDWISGLSETYGDLQSASDATLSVTHS